MSDTTTTAPPAAPSAATTAAPSGQSTSAPGQSTTAAPGGTTTTGSGPSIQATLTIAPDDGSPQNPNSYQVPVSATLTLNWTATNASSVNITGVGDGQGATGSATIPTQDGTITLVAVADGGAQSTPFAIDIATHPDGDVVSGHSDLSSGVAMIVSFTATKDSQTVTTANVGDQITLTAVVSESTDACTINGADASLADDGSGNKQATAAVTIASGDSGDYSCTVSAGGTAGDPGSLHLDIGPAGNTTTTAAPGNTTTQGPSGTTTVPGTTTTQAPGSSTTIGPNNSALSTTTTASPGASTTASANTTTTKPPGSTTTQPGSTTTAAIDDSVLTNEKWLKADGSDGTDQIGHGEAVKLYVETPGIPVGTTVYFSIWQQESGGDWTALPAVTAQVAKDDSTGLLSAQADFTTPADNDDSQGGGTGSDGSGSGGGSGDPGTAGSGSDDLHCSFGFTPSFTNPGSSGS